MNAFAQNYITAGRSRFSRSWLLSAVPASERFGALSAGTLEPEEVFEGVPSAFSARREPVWVEPTIRKILDLLRLREGWDGHDGKPISPDVAIFTLQFLLRTLDPATPAPQIVPLSYGGLQLEWHQKGIDLEVEIIAPNRVYVTVEDHRTGREIEGPYETDFRGLSDPIDELTNR